MLYIIGLGLGKRGISDEGLEIAKRCKKIYLENYTVDFPYETKKIEEVVGKKISLADRNFVEGLKFIDEAKKMDVALLIYGSPLTATTHITILQEAKASGIKCKVIFSASILDAVAETGLQIYKFGKIASMPKFEADSFMEIIKDNQKINAHSLILIDIGLELQDALKKLKDALEKYKIKINKIIVGQCLGTKYSKVFYDSIENLGSLKVRKPYCIIIPEKLHFVEEEYLELLK